MASEIMKKALEASQKSQSSRDDGILDEGDPYEIVNSYIFAYTNIKKAVLDKLPKDRRVRTKALLDLQPSDNYAAEEAMTVHSFKRDTELIVMGKLNDEWLIGYIRYPGGKEESDVRIFPSTYVRLLYTSLPRPLRPYEIKDWITFGIHYSLPQEQNESDNFRVDPRGVAMKSLDVVGIV